MAEEDAYNIALQELQGQKVAQGIWAKAMAYSDGEENKAKANHLKFRADQLLKNEGILMRSELGGNIPAILFSPFGRTPRWLFGAIVACCAFFIILGAVIIDSASYSSEGVAITLCVPFFLLSAGWLLAAHINRARDAGASPYLVLIYLIPWSGWLFLLPALLSTRTVLCGECADGK